MPGNYEVVVLYKARNAFKGINLSVTVNQILSNLQPEALLKTDFKALKTSGTISKQMLKNSSDMSKFWEEQPIGHILVNADAECAVSIRFDSRSPDWKSGMYWRAIELRRVSC